MGILEKLRSRYSKPNRIPADRHSSVEKSEFSQHRIENALDSRVQEKKLSMLSKPNKRRAMIPDLLSPETLRNIGLTERDGKWYVPNTKHFPDPISEDSVIIDYTRDGGAPDIGFC